jgi:hypothetical protein
MEKAIIKIRFNNDCSDGKSYWRAIIDGVEHHVEELIINSGCKTTKDYLTDKQDYKWHITTESNDFTFNNGILTIN